MKQTNQTEKNSFLPLCGLVEGSQGKSDLFHLYLDVVHFLVHPNFDLVSSLLALFTAKEVAQMTIEIIECYHLR